EWFDMARGTIESGDRVIKRNYLLDETPCFVKAGTVIPGQVPPKRLNDKYYRNLIMDIYPGESGSYDLYEDDGISTAYLNGESAIIEMAHETVKGGKKISLRKKSGNFTGYEPERSLLVRLHALIPPQSVICNGRKLSMHYRLDEFPEGWNYDAQTAAVFIRLKKINLDAGAELTLEMPKNRDFYISGFKGIFNRLRQANCYNVMLTGCGIIHPQERLGQELAHTPYRISRTPESFTAELAALREKLPQFPPILDFLADSNHKLEPTAVAQRREMVHKAKCLVQDATAMLQ
ncbi:MAG: DUF5110 domain-containing protein, partial [Victivallales bacterium]|nr:DUF5110 domain-containing protein [Victivallales bacterium]